MGSSAYAPLEHGQELEAEGSIPVATAVDSSSFSSLATAEAKIDGSNKQDQYENNEDGITITWEKGEVQPSEYRDKWFALAFLMHLVAVVGTAVAFAPSALSAMGEDTNSSNANEEYSSDADDVYGGDNKYSGSTGGAADNKYSGSTGGAASATEDAPPKEFWIAVGLIAMFTAPALSLAALSVMNRNPVGLIKCSILFSIVLCGISSALFMAVSPLVGVMYAVFAVCLFWYYRRVQSRIPYAACNLKAGILVLKTNLGLGLVAIGSMMCLVAYTCGWSVGFMGTMQQGVMIDDSSYSSTNSQDQGSDLSALGGFIGFLFVLSFYWTHQVFQNIVRTTVSGVVGTWWFSPIDASSFCSSAVSHSLLRSTTYSLGSICFGSLIVAILKMMRDSLRRARHDRNGGILICIALCILAYIEAIAEYFNKWAYIYVGLYGYSYIEAGKRVISLFKTCGWETIIADNLVNRLLGIMCLAIGLLTGVCTLFAAFVVEELESVGSSWIGIGFVVGFIIGLVISSIFLGLLSSAVDAIIVCYAESPQELHENHHEIAQEMSQTWSEAWGRDMCGPVIVGLGGGLGVV